MPLLLRGSKEESRRTFSGDPEEFRLSLVEHLEELRTRIIRSLLILSAGWVIGWQVFPLLYGRINHLVNESVSPVLPKGTYITERFDTLTEAFVLKVHFSFLVGMGIAFPFLVLQLWGFIEPGLTTKESKPIRRLAPFSVGLFLMGAGFAWAILPDALRWLGTYVMEFPGTSMILHAGSMVFFVMRLLIAFGFAFQLPLFVYVLGELELLTAETLIKYWRQAATGIFIVAMIVTPSNDPGTMLAMAIPLVILFMISVYVVKISQARKRKAAEKANGYGNE